MNETIQVVVPKRQDQVTESTFASTDMGTPDAVLQPMNIVLMILVRAARNYFASFLGMLTAAGLGQVAVASVGDTVQVPVGGWQVFITAAYLALFPAAYSLVQNAAELFARLDEKFPKLRA